MTGPIIQTENVSKTYGDVHAVSELSIHVGKGEIYGFLGLNGAGKTTTIRMLLGMIKPTSGHTLINGIKVTGNTVSLFRGVGALVEIPYAYPELTVRENLEVMRRLHHLRDRSATDRVMDRLQLTAYADRKAKNLSLGNSQRLGLAKAFIHEPGILILDEPTNGLDPAGIFEIREMLTDLAVNKGVTVFVSSHILSEVSRFATRIGIIHQGRLMKELNAVELEKLCRKRLVVDAIDRERLHKILKEHHYTLEFSGNDHLILSDDRAIGQPDAVATLLVHAGCPPTQLKVEEEDLEAFFLRTIGMKGGMS